jgi:AcrR family transcriptional regulator
MKSSRYHSPLRREQAAATRSRILAAAVTLMESGTDLTYGAIAKEADIQERTVYRYFPTKADLQIGVWEWITARLTRTDFAPGTSDDLIADMRRAFAGFDASAPLVQSMLHAPQGIEVRVRQQPARAAMFRRCVDAAVPDVPAPDRERAAAALQVLYSAPSWDLLRTFWGMDAARAADTVELAIRALLTGLPAVIGDSPEPGSTRRSPSAGAREEYVDSPLAEAARGETSEGRTPS